MTNAVVGAPTPLPAIPAGTPWAFVLEARYELAPTEVVSESARVRFSPDADEHLNGEEVCRLANQNPTIYDSTRDPALPSDGLWSGDALACQYSQQLAALSRELLRSPAARILSALKTHLNPRGDRPAYLSLHMWALVAPDPVYHEMALFSLQIDLRAYNRAQGAGMFIPGKPNIGSDQLLRDGDPIFALYVEDGEALCTELAAAVHATAGI